MEMLREETASSWVPLVGIALLSPTSHKKKLSLKSMRWKVYGSYVYDNEKATYKKIISFLSQFWSLNINRNISYLVFSQLQLLDAILKWINEYAPCSIKCDEAKQFLPVMEATCTTTSRHRHAIIHFAMEYRE